VTNLSSFFVLIVMKDNHLFEVIMLLASSCKLLEKQVKEADNELEYK